MTPEARPDPKTELERRKAELLASIDPAVAKALAELSDDFKSVTIPESTAEPQGPPPLPETAPAICAAITHTFTIAPAKASATDVAAPFGELRDVQPENEDERNVILANATPIMLGGQRRLQLSDEARGDLLDRVRNNALYSELLLRATIDDGKDFEKISRNDIRLPGAWLRSFLVGKPGDVSKAPPREVRAAVDALFRLQFARSEVVKKRFELPDARRALELSALLEPLKILIGLRGGWNNVPLEDRFVGRDEELLRLRRFVDELASRGARELVQRFFERAFKGARYLLNISDESVFFIIARGGIGKTTLIAKFVLDHALNQAQPFPFAYLDFDRATLHTRDPRQLLLETARQVALQFPVITAQVESLTNDVRREIADDTASSVAPFDRFRDMVRTITQGRRAFLVVFDAMEVVQYDPRSLAAAVNFISYLNGLENPLAFPELKVVASGRADVPELRTEQAIRSEKNRLELKALSWDVAVKMAQAVGRDFLGDTWNPQWGALVAGRSNDPEERREPLVIRVAVELIRGETNSEKREKLVQSIARDGENATEDFVGLLYERRILEHVQDEEVRKLAWPGLVVRRVTKDLIATTLAPICELDPNNVDHVFDALANEVWMVEEEEGGRVLRHRPDLRARTLPLMRRRDPDKFAAVNNAALRYYASRSPTPSDRAEWLYHRLLGGEPPESIDRDWIDEMASLLAGAADDFAPDSATRAYLLARTARTLLPPALIAKLSPRFALDHIAHTGAQLGAFDDTRIEPVVADIVDRIADPAVASSEPHPVKAVMLIKAGRWDAAMSFDGGTSEWRDHAEFARRFRRARTLGLKGNTDTTDPPDDNLPLRALIQDLAAARILRLPFEDRLDQMVADRLQQPLHNPGPSDLAALRTAVVFGWRASVPAARAWFSLQNAPGAPRAVSLAEFSALLDVGREQRRVLRAAIEPLLPTSLNLSWTGLTRAVRAKAWRPRRIGHSAIRRAVLVCAQALLEGDDPDNINVLRRFFAARDDDWIVPCGYAAARILGPSLSATEIFDRLSDDDAVFEPGFRPPEDALQVLRFADEASDIPGAAAAFLDGASSSSQVTDLRRLYGYYVAWREQIEELLERNEAEGDDVPPPAGRILNPGDLQKGRWGGTPERNGRRLEAKIQDSERDTFTVNLFVSSTDGSELEGPVLFHLHDSYPRKIIHIRRIREDRYAVLEEITAHGTFTVGAQVKAVDGRWIGLELDLAELPDIPARFIGR
jgi:hypothetical protein